MVGDDERASGQSADVKRGIFCAREENEHTKVIKNNRIARCEYIIVPLAFGRLKKNRTFTRVVVAFRLVSFVSLFFQKKDVFRLYLEKFENVPRTSRIKKQRMLLAVGVGASPLSRVTSSLIRHLFQKRVSLSSSKNTNRSRPSSSSTGNRFQSHNNNNNNNNNNNKPNQTGTTMPLSKKPMKIDPKQRGLGMFLQKGVNIATQAKGEGTTTPPKKKKTVLENDEADGAQKQAKDTTPKAAAAKKKTTKKEKSNKTTPSRQSARKREKPEKLDGSSPPKKPKAAGPTKYHENSRREKGYKRVCGVDEAGRGPLAGPVIAAACILPEGVQVEGVDDSKKFNSEEERELLYEAIMADKRIETSYWICDEKRIDQINILEATMECMRKSTETLPGGPVDWALIDGNKIPKGLEDKAEAIVKGDAKSQCIATASIVAKVTRDRMMRDIDAKYPQYGFKDHKGYGTKSHCQAIEKYGPCEHHRMTFAPIKYMDLSKYE